MAPNPMRFANRNISTIVSHVEEIGEREKKNKKWLIEWHTYASIKSLNIRVTRCWSLYIVHSRVGILILIDCVIDGTYRCLQCVPEYTVVMSVLPESLQNAIGDTLNIRYINKDQNANDDLNHQNKEQERCVLCVWIDWENKRKKKNKFGK